MHEGQESSEIGLLLIYRFLRDLRALRGEFVLRICFPALPALDRCAVLSLDVAEKHLGFGNMRVGIADAGGKIVANISRHDSRVAPVPGNADLIDHPAFDKKWLKAFGDERIDLDGTPRTAHNHAVPTLDAFTIGV